MTLEHVHGPAMLARIREAQRAVLDYGEQVAHGRRNGTLTRQQLDQLADAYDELHRLRSLYIRGTAPDAP